MKTPDWALVFEILKDGRPHHVREIMSLAKPGCLNWACRNRVGDLKRKILEYGWTIKTDLTDSKEAIYTLVPDMELHCGITDLYNCLVHFKKGWQYEIPSVCRNHQQK